MTMRTRTRQIPTVRDMLMRLHKDLFTIDKKHIWVDPDEPLIPVEKMILVLEDHRFFWHNGVDIFGCLRELLRALTIQPHGGASTIDMQFVRTATGFREKTYRRKLYEMILAVLIQFRYNKLEILKSYLGCAYFGSHLYGLETVSREIYNKSPG
jgi:membrane peptidoglycan carboxypeptidase